MKLLKILLLPVLIISVIFGSFLNNSTSVSAQLLGKSKISSDLIKLLRDTFEPVEVIVTFKTDNAPSEEQVQLLNNVGVQNGIVFESLPMAGITATASQIKLLAASGQVLSIYPNRKLQYENEQATSMTGIDQVRTDTKLIKQNGGFPVTGYGIGVVINDSGVDGTHQDIKFGSHLVQNVLGSTNLNAHSTILPISYVENVPNTDTNSGHGTHVAGIVGATGAMSGGKYEGASPGAKLIGYGSGAALAMLDTLGGFDYALTHQREYNIRVITNSWGDTSQAGLEFDPKDPINVATKKLYDHGIITVFSAGNSGPGEATISGNYKKAPWVITVAAGDREGKLTSFSSRGIKDKGGSVEVDGQTWKWQDRPTVTAPGSLIISTRAISPLSSLGAPDDVNMIDPAHLPYYTTMSGTSMAAPHVAGVIPLLLEVNPSLTPLEIKSIIEQTATPMSGYETWENGAGYINAYEAVKMAFQKKY